MKEMGLEGPAKAEMFFPYQQIKWPPVQPPAGVTEVEYASGELRRLSNSSKRVAPGVTSIECSQMPHLACPNGAGNSPSNLDYAESTAAQRQ
jgi:hypothetical protein